MKHAAQDLKPNRRSDNSKDHAGTWLVAVVALLCSAMLLGILAPAAAGTGWSAARLIEKDNQGNAFLPQVAFKGGGNAVAVWYQFDGAHLSIWANQYVAGTGWGTAEVIAPATGGDARYPQVAADGGGNAVAVWEQAQVGRLDIWSNRYVAGEGWGTAVLLETDDAGDAVDPQVALDGSGNAVAVWSQSDGVLYNIWSNRYVAGAGWGTAVLLETNSSGAASNPQVAFDGGGNAVAVWIQSDGVRGNIWSNRYLAGTGWGTAELVEMYDGGSATFPHVAVEAGGDAVAVWPAWDGSRYNVWSNRYVAGTGWGTAGLIETDNAGDAQGPRVAVDGAGNALAVWHQSNGTRLDIWSNRYLAGIGWSAPGLIEMNNSGDARDPEVAFDAGGNAVAVWTQLSGGRYNIWAVRYLAGTGWSTPGLLETDNRGDALFPQVAVDGNGNAIAVWHQDNGLTYDIWANHLVDDHPPYLSLTSLPDVSATNRSTVWVGGLTEPGATLTINGIAASVSSDGSFGVMLALSPGANVVEVTAWDLVGNRATVTANVTFADPVPGLDRDLSAANAELASAQANLLALAADDNVTTAQLAAAQQNLTSAQARVAALEASAASTQADLVAARDQMNATQAALLVSNARIAALEANRTSSQAPAASGDGSGTFLAMILGGAGIAVGVVALWRSARGSRGSLVANPPADPPPKP